MARLPKIKLPKLTVSNEHWVIFLLWVAPPTVAYVWSYDWRAALTAFLVTQIVVGIIKERYS